MTKQIILFQYQYIYSLFGAEWEEKCNKVQNFKKDPKETEKFRNYVSCQINAQDYNFKHQDSSYAKENENNYLENEKWILQLMSKCDKEEDYKKPKSKKKNRKNPQEIIHEEIEEFMRDFVDGKLNLKSFRPESKQCKQDESGLKSRKDQFEDYDKFFEQENLDTNQNPSESIPKTGIQESNDNTTDSADKNKSSNDPPKSPSTQTNTQTTTSLPLTKKNTSEYCIHVRNCFCQVTKNYKNKVITEQFRQNKLKRCIKHKCKEIKGCRNNIPEIHPKFHYWFNNTTDALKKERKIRLEDLKSLQVPEGQNYCVNDKDFDSCDSL